MTCSRFSGLLALEPVASFRLYCDVMKRGKFYQVVILRRKDQVPVAARIITGEHRGWSKTSGFCHGLDVLRKTKRGWHPTRLAGFVVLVHSALSSGYVSHELTHAAHFRLLRTGGQKRRPWESVALGDDRIAEPLAWMQGWLVAQFWVEFYRLFPTAVPVFTRRK